MLAPIITIIIHYYDYAFPSSSPEAKGRFSTSWPLQTKGSLISLELQSTNLWLSCVKASLGKSLHYSPAHHFHHSFSHGLLKLQSVPKKSITL